MNDQLAIPQPNNVALDKLIFDDLKLATIHNQICKNGTPVERELFVATCEMRGLNPLLKQIYFIKYGQQAAAYVVAIDGLRLIADRTGRYAPGPKAVFTYDADGKLFSATAFVKKRVGNEWILIEEEAFYDEFVQMSNGQPRDKWKNMPRVMLAKCAEARCLRRGFPEETGGLYVHEELERRDDDYVVEAMEVEPKEPPTGRKRLKPPAPAPVEAPAPAEITVPNLTFKTGDYAGKTPEECPTVYLVKCHDAWKGGSKHRPEMLVEVERVLSLREQSTGDGTEELQEEAPPSDAVPFEDLIDEPTYRVIQSYGTRLHGKDWVKVINEILGMPVGKISQAAALELIEKLKAEIGVESTPETAPPAEAPKASQSSPSLRGLMASINDKGLSMDEGDREERLKVVNQWLAMNHKDDSTRAPEIKSFKDLDNDMRFTLAAAIKRDEVTWTQAAVETEELDEEAV